MSSVGAISVLIGVLIIIGRGPLIFWPEPTREFYLKMIATNNRVRLIGLFLVAIAVVMIVASRGDPRPAAMLIQGMGWIIAFVGLIGELIFASITRLIGEAVLEAMDSVVLRGMGILAMGLAAFFIWLGISALG